MDCQSARQMLLDPEQYAHVADHLEACEACRAEAAMNRRIGGAVAALPRVVAPEELVARVMAGIRLAAEGATPAPRLLQMALRPWEIGWLGALFLLTLALIPIALGRWLPSNVVTFSFSMSEWAAGVQRIASDTWERGVTVIGPAEAERIAVWAGASLAWLIGAAAFALALYLFLSWRPAGGPGREMEDAHA